MTADDLPTGTGSEAPAGEDSPGTVSGRLLSFYERYLGEPDREVDVLVGFGLFFGGIALAAVGLLVFLASTTQSTGTAPYWQFREVAIALAALGLPAFVLSVVVLLPVDRRIVGVGAAGAVVCLGALALFVAAYPYNWNVTGGQDYSAQGIAIYGVGLAVLAAASGSSLVAYHLQRTTLTEQPGIPASDGAAAGGAGTGDPETVTDEQVREDIDAAMSDAELSWGGVEKTETKRLKLDSGDADAELDSSNVAEMEATTVRSAGDDVDDAVAGLRRLQGVGPGEETRGSSTEDTVAALNEFRERKGAELETGAEEEGVVDRLKSRLFD